MLFSNGARFKTNRPAIDVMFDIEATGKRPGCCILSLGAVVFDARAPFFEGHQTISLENQFLATISHESGLEVGLEDDKTPGGTMEWWGMQSEEARKEAFGGTIHIREALIEFSKWIWKVAPIGTDSQGRQYPMVNVWSHGEDYDQPILTFALELLGIERPWPYNGGRDTRSIFDVSDVSYKGVKHMALEDALDQTLAIRRAFHELGRDRGFEPVLIAA
ncbi:3'-5' exonuclease [Rhizobium leguminosarum]|uniref:3'-5' exonuclease n=1 Tax=Rhizobium leguminosarum TaxID=384 RepID=UPI002E0FFC7E|nr:3'-5' exonuclease [Rhizobium leguminosarum]